MDPNMVKMWYFLDIASLGLCGDSLDHSLAKRALLLLLLHNPPLNTLKAKFMRAAVELCPLESKVLETNRTAFLLFLLLILLDLSPGFTVLCPLRS